MIRNFFKKKIKNIFNFFQQLIIKQILNGKSIMPNNIPFYKYEIFKNINDKRHFKHKIILPYTNIDFINNGNIYKPYEIIEVTTLDSNTKKSLKLGVKTKDLVLPIAILNHEAEDSIENINLEFGNTQQKLQIKYKNRFHYLPIKSEKLIEKIIIKSDLNNIAIGKPIIKDKKLLKNKSKLIVHIFVDALTQSIIDKFGFKIMPNTQKYFEKSGTFYTNAYAQSEWTLSSVAGIFTGKYTHDHLIHHPRRNDKINHSTLADVLQKENYLTYACTNIPKLSPINGFDKGFDRYILAVDKDYNYIINEACEQLDAFGGNQYLFLGFFDIHETHSLQPISSQVSNDLKDFQYKPIKGNSKDTSRLYDEERINMFKNSIKHFDKKLKRLYDKIDKFDKDALVVLHSDHGVNFMSSTTELLGKEREKVIFLYKNNKKFKIDNSIREIRELPSIICNDLKISKAFQYNFNSYAITESIYPDKDYELAIRNNVYVLFFKIAWSDVIKKNTVNFQYRYSMHPIENESEIINECEQLENFIMIAKECYYKLIKNHNNLIK